MSSWVVLFVVTLLGSSVAGLMLARKRGYDGDLFAIGGLLAGPLAIWAVLTAASYAVEEEPLPQDDPAASAVTPQPVGGAGWQRFAAGAPPQAPQPVVEPQQAPEPVIEPQQAPEPVIEPQQAPELAVAPQQSQQAPEPVKLPPPALPPLKEVPQPVKLPEPKLAASQPVKLPEPQLAPEPVKLPEPQLEVTQQAPEPVAEVQQTPEAQENPGVKSLVDLITSEAPKSSRYAESLAPEQPAKKKRFSKEQPPAIQAIALGQPIAPGEPTYGICPHCSQESCADWYGLCVHCMEAFPVAIPYIDPTAGKEPVEADGKPEDKKVKESLIAKLRKPIKIGS